MRLHSFHRFFLVAVISLFLVIPINQSVADNHLNPQQQQQMLNAWRELARHLSRIGLSLRQGIPMIIEGMAQALPGSAQEAAAFGVGFRDWVTYHLYNTPIFLRTVAGTVGWLIDQGLITPETVNKLAHGSSWHNRIPNPRGGAVSLEALVKLAAAVVAANWGYQEGYEYTRVFLYEMNQFASNAEAEAYADLLASLVQTTSRPDSNVILCGGMTYAEAATRLSINMRTSPTKPLAKIACTRLPDEPPSNCLSPEVSSVLTATLIYHCRIGYGCGERCATSTNEFSSSLGYFKVRDTGKRCEICPEGYVKSAVNGSSVCVRCPKGRFFRNGCCY